MNRKELSIGIIIELFYAIINWFITVPDFPAGVIQGVAMALIVIGILPDKAYEKISGWKKSLFKTK